MLELPGWAQSALQKCWMLPKVPSLTGLSSEPWRNTDSSRIFKSLGSLGIYLTNTISVHAEKGKEKLTALKITFPF